MHRPNTRLSSTTGASSREIVTRSGLANVSRGERVTSRDSVPTQGRGKGTTPVSKKPSLISQSSSSNRALRGSSGSRSLESYPSGEIEGDSFGHELITRSLTTPEASFSGDTSSLLEDNQTLGEMAPGIGDKEGDSQTSGRTMEGLLQYFREAMRNTQEEFRRELATLRESIGNIASAGSDSVTPAPNVQLSGSQANSSTCATFNMNIKLKDWKISYSGEGSVSDFLFKLDTLVERSQCSHDRLMSNFHIFLTGKAETFYWDYIKQHQSATYPMLRTALSKEFGSSESDHEILLKLSTRRQLAKESYDDYHSFMVRLNLRLTNPLTDVALMEIIKKNVHTDLKMMLFIANPNDLGNLRDLARKAEKILLQNKNTGFSRRQVNEISVETTPEDLEMDSDSQVGTLKVNKTWAAGDYSKIRCWNCLELGHSYIYCPDEKRNIFCYKCGQKGVTTVKCDKPHGGNIRRNEWATGDARSSK